LLFSDKSPVIQGNANKSLGMRRYAAEQQKTSMMKNGHAIRGR
jgi:hypothetical protein